MLLGRFDGKIRNGEMLIPRASWRSFLSKKVLHLFSPQKGCLEVVSEDRLSENERKMPHAGIARLKKRGFLVVPQEALKFADLNGSEVVIIGMMDRFEIWYRNAWKKKVKEDLKKVRELLKTITWEKSRRLCKPCRKK